MTVPKVLLNVKLYGYWGLPDIEADVARAPTDVGLPDDATLQDLLGSLADRYGERFRKRILGLVGVSSLIGDFYGKVLSVPFEFHI